MNAEFTGNVSELVRLLLDQRVQYRKLQSLTQRQKTLIVDDDPQALLGLLSERQRVVDELTSINTRLAPYRRQWTRVYETLDHATRDEVKELLEESNALLSSIMSSDRDDVEMLRTRRQVAADSLSQTRVAGRAVAAYGSSANTAAVMAEASA